MNKFGIPFYFVDLGMNMGLKKLYKKAIYYAYIIYMYE